MSRRITRQVGGLSLVVITPSRYHWSVDPKMEFLFDGALWWVSIPPRGKSFPSLAAAASFCHAKIAEALQ